MFSATWPKEVQNLARDFCKEDPVHINDFNATILHTLGIDHERFTVKHQGLDAKLTGVETARVVKEILA